MKIPYEALLPFYRWMWRYWRAKRWVRFRQRIRLTRGDKVLDVGGHCGDWAGRGEWLESVDILNLYHHEITEQPGSPRMRSLAGDGCALPFADGSYDVLFSNSVIEHVGGWEEQMAFAAEARRVGKRLWIQTPAFGCPVEPHFLGLFIHWFPRRWHVPLARWTSVVGLTGAADLNAISSSTRLLTKKQCRQLFPDCEIWTERLFLVFPKSHIAIRTARDKS